MPFTPFHFGPGASVALPLQRHLDIPVFILASIAVDIEPLAVIVFGLDYPLHGYCHTLLIGTVVGIMWASLAYLGKDISKRIMDWMHLNYDMTLKKILLSSVLGVWFHVLLDAPLYFDIRPFYPLDQNPLLGLINIRTLYIFCGLSFIPAVGLYYFTKESGR